MTKVLALVTDAFGGRGGIAQYNRDLFAALARAEYDVSVLTRLTLDPAQPRANIRQFAARRSRLGYGIAALALAARLKPEIVFCGHLHIAPLALFIARLTGAKLVLQFHGIEAWQMPCRLQRASVEAANLVLCVSRYTRACVLTWASLASERAIVIPNTIRDVFSPGDRAHFRSQYGLNGRAVLLSVGRLSVSEQYKGHELVMAALPVLVAAGHDAHYIIIGEGDDRPRLEKKACAMGVADRVTFLGCVDLDTLVQAYRAADVFAMPSRGEGFGIVFLEAAACGTPSVALDAGGASDALADGALGEVTNETGVTDALLRTLAAPPKSDLSTIARERFGCVPFDNRVYGIFGALAQQ